MKYLGIAIIVLFSVCLLGIACDDSESESFDSIRTNGITKGIETNYELWKGVIAVVSLNGGQPEGICTGTLIHPRVALTAGHCVLYKGTSPLEPSYDHVENPDELLVRAGANVGNGGEGELLSEVEAAIAHPTWTGNINTAVQNGAADLALLLLKNEITSEPNYCVREDDSFENGDPGYVVGYGLLGTYKPNSSGVHRYGKTTLRDVQEASIEIGDPSGTCQGDSGGPLFTEFEGNWEVTGVTSYGGMVCMPKKGSYVANATNWFDWINESVEEWTGDSLGECTATGPDADIDTDTDTDSDTDSDTDADSDTDTDIDTEADAGDDTDTGDAPNPEADGGDDDDSGMDSDDGAGCGCRTAAATDYSLLTTLLDLI
jgi:Trypsin